MTCQPHYCRSLRTDVGTFLVDQALHGYREGHRQLASSMSLDSESARQLSMASDLSSALRRSFDGYVSGYFLESADVFVFAKTWFADEIPRPGAVWTHSLFLRGDQLAQVDNLRIFRTLFQRPTNDDFDDYFVPAALELDGAVNENGGFPPSATAAIIDALYSTDNSMVVVPAESASVWENVFLDIWSLGWPDLRKHLSFTTGAAEPRRIGGRAVDIVASPQKSVYQFMRGGGVQIVDVNAPIRDKWAAFISVSLGQQQRTAKDFFWSFGPSLPPKRTSAKTLAEVLVGLTSLNRDQASVRGLIELANNAVPSAHRWQILSRLLDPEESAWTGLRDPALLEELLTTPAASQLDVTGMDIGRRTLQVLSARGVTWFADLYESAPTRDSPLWDFAAGGLAEFLQGERSRQIRSAPSGILSRLVGHRPTLINDIDAGSIDSETWEDVATAAVVHPDSGDRELSYVASTELQRRSGRLARALFDRSPHVVISAILEAHGFPRDIPSSFKSVLVDHFDTLVSDVVDRKTTAPKEYVLLAYIAAGSDRPLTEAERFQVMRLRNKMELGEDAESVAIVDLISGLRDAAGPALLLSSFATVHDALSRDALPGQMRDVLEELLPLVHSYDRWDLCKRLRVAVLQHFLHYAWPIYELVGVDQRLRTCIEDSLRWDLDVPRKTVDRLLDARRSEERYN
jgi:hypothetical protein